MGIVLLSPITNSYLQTLCIYHLIFMHNNSLTFCAYTLTKEQYIQVSVVRRKSVCRANARSLCLNSMNLCYTLQSMILNTPHAIDSSCQQGTKQVGFTWHGLDSLVCLSMSLTSDHHIILPHDHLHPFMDPNDGLRIKSCTYKCQGSVNN